MPRITRITARDNPLLGRLRKLVAQPDAYRKLGSTWLEGEHLCSAWLDRAGGAGVQAVIGEAAWGAPAWARIAGRAEAVAVVADGLWAGFSGLETPAPLGFVVAWPGAGTIAPGVATVVLDRLQDPGNVGTILRSAAAFGFAQVIALKGTAALWSPKVLRAGMGAHVGLRLVETVDVDALEALAIPMLATSPHAVEPIDRGVLPWPCAWALGHEGQGIAPALQRRCLRTLRIPQPGGEESLNVAAAAAICLYESARQRGAG
jgi:TrmH family RNA methyltransferase